MHVHSAAAQNPTRVKGPLVWLDMDQSGARRRPTTRPSTRRTADSVHAAQHIEQQPRARHGSARPSAPNTGRPDRGARLSPARPDAPVNVFIHGGAWRGRLATNFAYAAEIYVDAGAHYVVLDFVNVLEANGDLLPMAEQVRRAVAWVYRNAGSFGGDPSASLSAGHRRADISRGVALVTDWRSDYGLPRTAQGRRCCSGMYDLKAPRLSKRSNYVKFTDEMEHALAAASSRPAPRARGHRLRHARDARVPAAVPRVRRRGEGRRQAGRADSRRRLQPLRDAGDARKSDRACSAARCWRR